MAADEQPGGSSLKSAVHGTIRPLSRYARLALVLRYMPCVVVAIATHQEIGSWQWLGVAVAAACRACRQTMANRLAMGISPLDCLGQNTRTPLFFNNN